MLHIAAHKLMYDTIEKLNELGAKWLYVKNWLNQVVLLFRYAVMVHRLCKRPWMALDLTGNSTLSQRVLGSNVDLDCHYSDGIPKDAAYMEYDLGYAASAVVSQTRLDFCKESGMKTAGRNMGRLPNIGNNSRHCFSHPISPYCCKATT
ncbi:hypothetical protein NXS19_011524 [Fusarium pseudograminearum]|nr:hypothetical protein NXS19_011524 [Fusarium pseudograminearum]